MTAPASARPDRPRPLPVTRPLLRSVLGDVLRRTRRGQRRTLADVAEAARVSVPYLSEVERGRKEVSSEVLAAICDGLRVRLSDVLAEIGRELAADHARRARVEHLDAIRERRAVAVPARTTSSLVSQVSQVSQARGRGGDVVCLAA
jgi:transcriptional regulator with XRE-family HTH domain